MSSAGQRTVELLVRLHPAPFRSRFGEEMLLDYRELLQEGASTRLLLDVARSLATQWFGMLHPGDARLAGIAGSPRFLTNQPALGYAAPLTPYELAKGCMLSILLFSAFWYAESPVRDAFGSALLTSARAFSSGAPDTPAAAPVERIVVTDVTVLDLEQGRLSTPKNVMVENGTITSITDANEKRFGPNTQVVDGRGKFLMPGMWDMHTHIKHPEVDFPLYLANGVLGIRSMGGEQDKVFAWDAKLKDGSLLGPLAFVSGPILDGPGGPVEPKSYGVFIANGEQG